MKIDLTIAYEQVKSAVLSCCKLDDLLLEIVPVGARADLECVPRASGVYFIFSRPSQTDHWDLRYIGQIGFHVTLRQRLRQHLFDHPSSRTNSQFYYITEQTDQFGVAYREVTPEPARLLVEALCIELLDPPDNEKGKKREKA